MAIQIELARSDDDEKNDQISRLADFQRQHAEAAPQALAHVRATTISGGNVFAALVDAVQVCSLGHLTRVLFDVGGQYRRNL